jgi:REP element-mobilizing transposase RayT
MPKSLFKVMIHIVFSTKDRADLITPDIEADLFGYIQGIVENNRSKLILINGTTNHVHLLISLGKLADVPELIGDIKRSSSAWIKTKGAANFYWQRGYGVFFDRPVAGYGGNEVYCKSKETSQADRIRR